ncbi:uncharacterized protein LOC135378673 [Ornithodoros turicata]|uniref:uncharacterized protein LOC135378673 n=1 Tax=Ornithodoros turicata TaxID=34597 RepID=UPI003139A05F
MGSTNQELQLKGAISPIPLHTARFLSPFFLVPKKDRQLRPVLNLKQLNLFIHHEHFKMEGWDTVKDLLLQGDYLVRIDLKDAYLSVPIAKRDRPWLCFLHQGRCYQWNVLPFGLCSAPRVFTKIMKPIVAHLRSQGIRLVIFLDDILLMDQSPGRLRSSMQIVVNLLHSLGFVINQTKSHLTPTRTLTFLGFEIMTVPLALCLPVDKRLAIKQEIDSILGESIGVRALASLIGRLNATSLAVLAAPLHLRSLQSLLHQALQIGSYETTVTLSSAAREDLGWWRTVLLSHPRRSLHESSVLQTIQTDSSLQGWGAHSQGLVVGQQWTNELAQLHINELELRAAFLGLQALGRPSDQGCILLQLDNRAAVAAINRMGSTRSSSLNKVALQLWSWCLKRGLTVRAQHIPGRLNAVADRASRVHFDNSSWKLHVPTFQKIDSLWGPIKVDLFADLSNHQVPHYFSWKPDPGAAEVDAFTQICESMSPENVRDRRGPHLGSPDLAVAAMVPLSVASGLRRTSTHPTPPGSSPQSARCISPIGRPQPSPSCVEADQRPPSHSSLSGEAAGLISASWRRGTRLAYNSCWRRWDSWCSARLLDPFSPPLNTVLNFLAYLHYQEHLSYRTINSYRSALSQTIGVCEGHPLGEHPAVTRLLKGVFNLNPPRPRYSDMWPVESVTSFISSLGENDSLPLRLLSYKLVMLLALATAGRSADLCLLALSVSRLAGNCGLTAYGKHHGPLNPGHPCSSRLCFRSPPSAQFCAYKHI